MYNTIVYSLYIWYRLPVAVSEIKIGQRLPPTFWLREIYSPCFTYQPSWMLLIQLFINLTFNQHMTNKSLYLSLTLLLLLRLVRVTSLSMPPLARCSGCRWRRWREPSVTKTSLCDDREVSASKMSKSVLNNVRLLWSEKKCSELISQIKKGYGLRLKLSDSFKICLNGMIINYLFSQ